MNAGILTSGYAAPTMPNRLLGRPAAVQMPISFRQEWHPDVLSWTRRASNNGGRFSYPTLLALQAFCESIDAAGLRSRMLRLNLMCGDNLNAALVPLYVAGSSTGDTLGNASDTNSNFVSGDYAESAGLLGNGSTKSLDTGFSLNTAGVVATGHLSVYRAAWTPVGERNLIGCLNAGFNHIYQIGVASGASAHEVYYGGSTQAFGATISSAAAHLMLTRTSSTGLAFYTNGSPTGSSSTSTSPADPARSVFVFARNQGGLAAGPAAVRMRAYSIGQSITAAQAATLYPIFAAFATALGRTPA